MKKIFFLFCIINGVQCNVVQKESINIREGNLAMRTSQQPAPLFSFGQITVDKGNIQGFLIPTFLTSDQKFFSTVIPAFIYGFTNELTFRAGLPVAAKYKQNNSCSSGAGDLFAEVEYVFHENQTPRYNNLISAVGILTFPSGSFSKQPPTGLGAPSILLGMAARHRAIDWYLWFSPGFTYTFANNHTHLGTNFVYQAGIGRNINYISQKRIITLMCEFLGSYTSATNYCGVKDRCSRSNFISIAPVLWISTLHLIVKAGAVIPLLQQVKNKTNKNNYSIGISLGYTFN